MLLRPLLRRLRLCRCRCRCRCRCPLRSHVVVSVEVRRPLLRQLIAVLLDPLERVQLGLQLHEMADTEAELDTQSRDYFTPSPTLVRFRTRSGTSPSRLSNTRQSFTLRVACMQLQPSQPRARRQAKLQQQPQRALAAITLQARRQCVVTGDGLARGNVTRGDKQHIIVVCTERVAAD